MTAEADRAKSIFLDALEIDSREARRAFVDSQCGADSQLRREVETLLIASDGVGGFLAQSPASRLLDDDDHHAESDLAGTAIGPYNLLELIGEGGMGVVYMAEQTAPVRRRVALKLIKPGMDSRHVIARFEAERQALAMMDHPYVAHVLDAGTTTDGRPYFVMELVKGVPITQYCDEHRLTNRERLKLFLGVCQAVQHAHHKGIIHRDLKPSNVLIAEFDHQAVPKVIDFGVAKALNQPLTEKTVFTHFGQVIGTLDYMSPEQAKLNQPDVDTRSDVYCLGVLLYELLAGTTPFDQEQLHSQSLDDVLRMIRETDPPRPSTRICSSGNLPALAAQRRTEPSRVAAAMCRDLDWIVMKALAKDRSDRYQTAAALADDIHRHLDDLPIAARRPSALAAARRFVRRNKIPVALAALAAAALATAVSLGLVAYFSRLAQREQAVAIRESSSRARQLDWAHRVAMPTIKRLVAEEHLVPAFRLALDVQEVLPDDPGLAELLLGFTETGTISTDPPGARVWIEDWNAGEKEWWQLEGQTPFVDIRLPRGELRFRIMMEGYAPREFQEAFPHWDRKTHVQLPRAEGIPPNMVRLDFGQAATWSGLAAEVSESLIDKYEVTNQEFQKFVDAGGYENMSFWKQPFVRDGQVIPWDEAVQGFLDSDGQHCGPATWRHGRFPAGEEHYPVRGVSWYEAAAYAAFVGKELPTLYHWQWAADLEEGGYTVRLSNFSGAGPVAVGTYRGIGRFGTRDMAGNVKEWCWNEMGEGRRCLRGGAWNEPSYMFGDLDAASPWERKDTYGFRCAKYLDPPATAALAPWTRPQSPARSRQPIGPFRVWYEYDRGLPLNPKILQRDDGQSRHYRHEIVQIDAAYNGERFNVHLLIPTGDARRREAIVVSPGSGVFSGKSFDDHMALDWGLFTALVETGRMVCYPVCKGTLERGDGAIPDGDSIRGRDVWLSAAKDGMRTVDYLTTRQDVDPDRLICVTYSFGTIVAPTALALEPRFKAAVLLAGGYWPGRSRPEIDPYNFTPHVHQPVLMISGRYDFTFPRETSQQPYFDDLGSTNKKHVVLECGHSLAFKQAVDIADQWLRETLGAAELR